MVDKKNNDDYLRLSPSGIALWKQCPSKWAYKYIHNVKEPSAQAPQEGTFTHAVLEEIMLREPEERTVTLAKELATDFWPDMVAGTEEFASLQLSDEEVKGFKWASWNGVEKAFDLVNPPSIDVKDVELDLEVEIFENTWFKGFIDLLEYHDGGVRVTDWKLSKPPKPKYANDKMIQLQFYAMVLKLTGACDPKSTRLVFLRQHGQIVESGYNDQDHEFILEFFEKTAKQIRRAKQKQEFKTRTGPLCGWCYNLPACEVGQTWLTKKDRTGALNRWMTLEETPVTLQSKVDLTSNPQLWAN